MVLKKCIKDKFKSRLGTYFTNSINFKLPNFHSGNDHTFLHIFF